MIPLITVTPSTRSPSNLLSEALANGFCCGSREKENREKNTPAKTRRAHEITGKRSPAIAKLGGM